MLYRPLRLFGFSSRQGGSNVLLTGIQPTGDLHIGNYLGAVRSLLQLQKEQYSS
jgi:tryptophanyl-tRNA synthetase